MANQYIFVQDTDWNLWLTQGPYGWGFPLKVQADGNVDPYASFQALNSNEVLVCGSDGNLWLETGPFGTVPLPNSAVPYAPSSRYQIDGSVAAFYALNGGEVFVLGQDRNLWYEFGFGTTIPTVPPPRNQVDGNVAGFWPVSAQEVFVLGKDGNLWQEFGPFSPYAPVPLPPCNGGKVSCRNLVDANVSSFQPVDSDTVYVVGTDGNLWLEFGPFGNQVPPNRVQVDGNVLSFWAVDDNIAYVEGTDLNLWQENAPFGTVPLIPCSDTSGFGQGFGCRNFLSSNVAAFGYFPYAGGVYVIDGDLNLWQLGTPPVLIYEGVISFTPLNPEQVAQYRLRRRNRTVRVPRKVQPSHSARANLKPPV